VADPNLLNTGYVGRGLMYRQGILFAPSFGFSYDVAGNGETAVGGGFDINYNALGTLTSGRRRRAGQASLWFVR